MPETCLILKTTERDMIKNVYWASCKVTDIIVGFYETCILSIDFSKYSNMISYEYTYSGSRIVSCGETDRYEEANGRFSQFCKCPLRKKIRLENKGY